MLKPQLFSKLMRFAVVGVVVMMVFMGLNWLWGRWVGKQAAFLLSYPPALGLHFYLNRRWTFGCRRTDVPRQIRDYLAMVAATFLVQWAVFSALAAWTPLPGWLEAGVANAAQMAITFVVMQRRVFAEPSTP